MTSDGLILVAYPRSAQCLRAIPCASQAEGRGFDPRRPLRCLSQHFANTPVFRGLRPKVRRTFRRVAFARVALVVASWSHRPAGSMTDKARLLNHLEVFADTVCTPSQEMSRISARLLRMTPRTRAAARKATARAIKAGKLTRPPVCSKCGNATDVQAHHTDYERPLDVTWLCVPCHRAIHAGDRRGQGRPARPLPRGAITPQGLKDAEVAFQLAQESVEELRGRRNGMVLDALEEGWTHAQIADATGMSRGRVSQIAKISRHNA